MTIVKKTVRSTDPVKGERSDKNQYPATPQGRGGAPAPRGTHQIKKVNTTAPNEWNDTVNDD